MRVLIAGMLLVLAGCPGPEPEMPPAKVCPPPPPQSIVIEIPDAGGNVIVNPP